VVSANPLYQPTLSLTYYLRSAAHYQAMLFNSADLFGVAGLLASWAVLALVAAWLRSRAMAFGLAFWALALIPIALLPPRTGFVLYLPAVGMALYIGVLLASLRAVITRAAGLPRWASQAALFIFVMSGVALANSARISPLAAPIQRMQRDARDLVARIQLRHPRLAPRARVLFLDDPFGSDPWFLSYTLQLLYRDPDIRVDIARNRPHARGYDYVFAYTAGRLAEYGPRPASCPPLVAPPGTLDDSNAAFCWSGDWTSEQFAEAIEGTITHTNHNDATVEVAFEGSSLTYIYTRAYNRGMASITIDGAPRGVIDLYSPVVGWHSSTVFRGLGPGRHRAILRVLGRHSPSATDSIVDADAFVISQ
jgi:hypothetical protein